MFWKRAKKEIEEKTTETKEEQQVKEPSTERVSFAGLFRDNFVKKIAFEKYELMKQKEAYFEPFAWLLKYLDDNPAPSVVNTGNDKEYEELANTGIEAFSKVSLQEHTYNVLTQGYSILKKIDPNFYLYEGQWVLTALGHDIGKGIIYRELKQNKKIEKAQHHEVSGDIMVNLLMYSGYPKLPFGVANSIIDAILRHHNGLIIDEKNILLTVLINADRKAREIERLKLSNPKEEIPEELSKLISLIEQEEISFLFDKKEESYKLKKEEIEKIINPEKLKGIPGVKIDEKFIIIIKEKVRKNVLRTG